MSASNAMRLMYLTAVLVAESGFAAIAQPQRTVESANRFLATALTNGARMQDQSGGGDTASDAHVLSANGAGCRMTIRRRASVSSLDWARISHVQDVYRGSSGTGAYIINLFGSTDDSPQYILFFSDEEVAQRAATAMTFLKGACDPAKGTGF